MKDSNDIANLYKTLGQNPNQYREVVRDEELAQANDRWPLIAAMHDSDFVPPPVDRKKRPSRERPSVAVFEEEIEVDFGARDPLAHGQAADAVAALADPGFTPVWPLATHDAHELVPAEPAPNLVDTGWVAPERTPAQIEIAAQAALAAQEAHETQMVKEAQASQDLQAQRDQFQDDTKAGFAEAPASTLSETTVAESLMDGVAPDLEQESTCLDASVEEEPMPVVVSPIRRRAVATRPLAEARPMLLPESVSLVSLTHIRMRATGDLQPFAALFSRLSGDSETSSALDESKKYLLFHWTKRT